MQVDDLLAVAATRLPNKVGLVCGEERFTYTQLRRRSVRLARSLAASGIRRGDRIAVYLDNDVHAVLSIFAILNIGAVFVLINSATKSTKLAYVLNDSGASLIITTRRHLTKLTPCLNDTPGVQTLVICGDPNQEGLPLGPRVLRFDDLLNHSHDEGILSTHRGIDADLSAIVYTSGSTGTPKGVMVYHAGMLSTTRSIVDYLEHCEQDVILSVLPLSFGYGLYQLLTSVMVGATLVLEKSFAYPAQVVDTLVRERASGFPMVPTIWAVLLGLELERETLSHLRYVSNAGAALPEQHIRQFRERYPHIRIYSMYGQTECQRICYLPPEQIDTRPASVGGAMPNLEVFVADETGDHAKPGVTGELLVRGASVMKGYWNAPEATKRVLKPGRFIGDAVLHTGDLFRTDEDGYLYFVGRMDDIIKTRGEKVSPKEVENVLHLLDEVAMAVVVGVADEMLGEVVKAVIVTHKNTTLSSRQLLRHCSRHLEEWMVPKLVEFREQLPTTPAGKIDKLALQRKGD